MRIEHKLTDIQAAHIAEILDRIQQLPEVQHIKEIAGSNLALIAKQAQLPAVASGWVLSLDGRAIVGEAPDPPAGAPVPAPSPTPPPIKPAAEKQPVPVGQ
jgi:hypothetical protein